MTTSHRPASTRSGLLVALVGVLAATVVLAIWIPFRRGTKPVPEPKLLEPAHTLTVPLPAGGIHLIALTPDGKQLYFVNSNAGVAFWDAGSGKLLHRQDKLDDPSERVSAIRKDREKNARTRETAKDQLTYVLGKTGTGLLGGLSAVVPRADRMHTALAAGRIEAARSREGALNRAVLMTGQATQPFTAVSTLAASDRQLSGTWTNIWGESTGALWSGPQRWFALTPIDPGEVFGLDREKAQTGPTSCLAWASNLNVEFLGGKKDTVTELVMARTVFRENSTYQFKSSTITPLPVRLVAFAPSGKVFLEAYRKSPIAIHSQNQGTHQVVGSLEDSVDIVWAVVTDDVAATATREGTVIIWDLKTGKIRHRLTDEKKRSVSVQLSTDGKRLVVARIGDPLQVLDPVSGQEVRTCGKKLTQAHFTLSGDGTRALVLQGQSQPSLLWDLETGKEVTRLPGMREASLSADGKRVAGTDGKQVWIWNLEGE